MTYSLKITNVHVVNADCLLENQDVFIENDKIVEISSKIERNAQIEISGDNHYLFPGFIDMHIHGSAGVDTMDATDEALHLMAKSLVKEGVTGFLATSLFNESYSISVVVVSDFIKIVFPFSSYLYSVFTPFDKLIIFRPTESYSYSNEFCKSFLHNNLPFSLYNCVRIGYLSPLAKTIVSLIISRPGE